ARTRQAGRGAGPGASCRRCYPQPQRRAGISAVYEQVVSRRASILVVYLPGSSIPDARKSLSCQAKDRHGGEKAHRGGAVVIMHQGQVLRRTATAAAATALLLAV